jgi:hypothetical protein
MKGDGPPLKRTGVVVDRDVPIFQKTILLKFYSCCAA